MFVCVANLRASRGEGPLTARQKTYLGSLGIASSIATLSESASPKASPNARQSLTCQRANLTKAVPKAVPKMVQSRIKTPVLLGFLALMWGFLVPLKGSRATKIVAQL